jgi:hypothetical protein
LSGQDHDTLDLFLETVLKRFRDGKIDINDARRDIAEAVSLAANDNANLSHYMRAVIDRER